MKKILIIGGTQFVGRNLVEHILPYSEYDITLFNRGKTNPDLFPEVNRIIGDRNTEDLHQIADTYWDCIIDISCYYPKPLEAFIEKLKGQVGRYIFISTASVYDFEADENKGMAVTEDFPLLSYSEEEMVDKTGMTYGKRKVACEEILLSKSWLDTIILRPALIAGRYDHTDRLYYWFYKLQTQDEFLLPNKGKDRITYTDVNDLARMMIQSIELDKSFSIYNAGSYFASIADFVGLIQGYLGKDVKAINAPLDFIKEQKIEFWSELPLWAEGDVLMMDSSRIAADFNFQFSSIEETTEKLMSYYGHDLNWRDIQSTKYGQISLKPEREAELLKLLKEELSGSRL